MCGRYTFTQSLEEAEVVLPQTTSVQLPPRYNIAPSQYAPIIPGHDPNRIHFYRWGLLPHWAKDPNMAYKMINARAETVAKKPAYREPVRKSRCLVLADGFYEWQKQGSTKQPYRIRLTSGSSFYFAGLTSHWTGPDGVEIPTYTIITTAPNAIVSPIHNRMPVILSSSAAAQWLDTSTSLEEVLSVLRPFPASNMQADPVSKKVGNVRNEGPELIDIQAPPPPTLFG